jgi:hypothetical protein
VLFGEWRVTLFNSISVRYFTTQNSGGEDKDHAIALLETLSMEFYVLSIGIVSAIMSMRWQFSVKCIGYATVAEVKHST